MGELCACSHSSETNEQTQISGLHLTFSIPLWSPGCGDENGIEGSDRVGGTPRYSVSLKVPMQH
jgi:hypothetical protein